MAAIFDAKVIKLARYDDGKVQHARLKIDDSIIMLNEATETYPTLDLHDIADQLGTSQMHIYVHSVQQNADKLNTLGIEKKCLSLMQPMMRPHGNVMAGFKDPFGKSWLVDCMSKRVSYLKLASL